MSSSLYTSRYMGITDQPQDNVRQRVIDATTGISVKLKNTLPVTVIVTQERPHPHFIKELVTIPPKGLAEIRYNIIKAKDILHFQYTVDDHGTKMFVAPSMEYRVHHGQIAIGSIASSNGGYNRDIHPNGDISSVRIWNTLPWPIYIYHNDRKAGWIHANDTLGHKDYHGNILASPNIYFDDGNMGLKLGDIFNLKIDNSGDPNVPEELYSFALHDRNISEIMIGQGAVEIDDQVKPETHMYRLGRDTPGKHNITSKLRGEYFPKTHNAPGTDHHRSSMKSSRVPVARHKTISRSNIMTV